MSRPAGFTLIELMIVVVIVAILAAIAYPAFMNSIYKSRRADAAAALTKAQQAQEIFRGSNAAYATSFGAGGLPVPSQSPDGHYSLSISNATASGYTITAQAQGVQAKDTNCKFLSVSMTAPNTLSYSASADGSTFATNGPCWSK
ncbi:MAG: prepilin-type N-terminal cleavage/methylation domain-containing protein [Burkholderiales bacterium]|nr:prepilin-type N-terminal cleavage/methylation domain-containing protein [Burkholderiales bacterium]